MKYTIHEVLDMASKEKTVEDRIKVLHKHDSDLLRNLLKMNFDKNLVWDLPEGEPPFKKDKNIPLGMGESNLFVEARRLYIFFPEKTLSKIKKEALFIQVLEGLHYTEAEMLCAVKDHELHKRYKGISESLIRKAYPSLLPEVVKEPKKAKSGTGSSE